jgi:glutaredoxin
MDTNEEYMHPIQNEFTIYSKLGCGNCQKVKRLFVQKKIAFSVIDCDDYLLENKEKFLAFMKEIIGKEWKTFPMVFDEKGQFIGGFTETEEMFKKNLDFVQDF